ncbi:anaerobic ribonucleoside-triphosphate reductase activating protein [Lacticigenium naphthae]|uniref:anaerobic ribonucleoside-triphosphate reductase activating protein n=1 Tax=Lacticigenium naphthae TaxID=515351 RepID=UPI0004288145|nr:anaerobic ribonucleoside-triphosphate reductase activating protein [Lacticigenium naphthae]
MNPIEWTTKQWSQNFIADYKPYNFVDGEGVRCSLYVSGCPFACKGCYNKAAQSFSYGTLYTKEVEEQIIEDLSADYCQGLTLLGGEPFLNTDVTIPLSKRVKNTFGDTKDIWSWSGYTYEEILASSQDKRELLDTIDVLVDGRFVLDQFDLGLDFRGSKNQRIIDVQSSLKKKKVVLWKQGGYK